jgi:DNA-binding response OmpR family regulator
LAGKHITQALPYSQSLSMRVLLVDDSSEILNILREALGTRGIEVVTANSVAAAKAAIDADGPPAAAIFDYDLRGRETGADLAERATAKGMRVAIMSGSIAGLLRFDDLPYPTLRKPFRFAELYSTVEALLGAAALPGD